MALSSSSFFIVRADGSDTANGGIFDSSRTAGMNTDGAATSATGASPVFTSASYSFVAGDVGAKVFIASGTNWTPGWYPIVSVSSGAATLDASIGGYIKMFGANPTYGVGPSTVAGCATTGSPTGATWSIDYSQQASAQYTYTDLASTGAGLTVSSAGKPFSKEQVGNSIVVTGGTNFTAGRYVISSIAAGVATVLGAANITTGAGSGGTGAQGGAFASMGQAGAHTTTDAVVWIKNGSYSITSASNNVAGGCISSPPRLHVVGYDTLLGDLAGPWSTGTRPTLTASGISSFTLISTGANSGGEIRNLILDGASLSSGNGCSNTGGAIAWVHAKNFTGQGIIGNTSFAYFCTATGCTGTAITPGTRAEFCEAYGNSGTGISATISVRCNSSGNATGFSGSTQSCNAYGNSGSGFSGGSHVSSIAEANGAYGFVNATGQLSYCGTYNNTSGAYTFASLARGTVANHITGTASFFTNPGSGDFSLNNTAGGGAAARAAGYPGLMPRGLTTGYADIGAAQHQDTPTTWVGVIGG